MRPIEKFLLARQRINRANRIVGASKRQQLFVARPTHAVEGIEPNDLGEKQFARLGVPNLDLAKSAGRSACDCNLFTGG